MIHLLSSLLWHIHILLVSFDTFTSLSIPFPQQCPDSPLHTTQLLATWPDYPLNPPIMNGRGVLCVDLEHVWAWTGPCLRPLGSSSISTHHFLFSLFVSSPLTLPMLLSFSLPLLPASLPSSSRYQVCYLSPISIVYHPGTSNLQSMAELSREESWWSCLCQCGNKKKTSAG